jgi:L-alanine-DL-glutamate epimerase-like enolase superfamily enzyme
MNDAPASPGLAGGLVAELHTLRLTQPFHIAHGSSDTRQVLRVSLANGVGEAPFVPYYNDTPETSLQWLRQWKPSPGWHPDSAPGAPRQARLALDLLWHDIAAKIRAEPLWKHLNLENPSGKAVCRSLSIPDDLDWYTETVQGLSRQFAILKLKLGSGNTDFDEAIAAKAREAAPAALLFADANGGWTVAEAAKLIPRLLRLGIAFVEQPVHHKEGVGPWKELRSRLPSSSMPLFGDESVQSASDLAELAGLIQGVNIKLLKCGGFPHALGLLERARAAGLKTILGCMIESSIGTTAAAHLAARMDYVDLDGHLYLGNDDYTGLQFDANGRLLLPERAGIGAVPITPPPHAT